MHDTGSGVDGLLQFLDAGGCSHNGVGELVGGGGSLVDVHGDGDRFVAGHGLYLVGGDAAVDHDVDEAGTQRMGTITLGCFVCLAIYHIFRPL